MTRTRRDGTLEILIDKYKGKKLNSPNDIAVSRAGRIWFTDPPYGLKRRKKELKGNYVFCFDLNWKVMVEDYDVGV